MDPQSNAPQYTTPNSPNSNQEQFSGQQPKSKKGLWIALIVAIVAVVGVIIALSLPNSDKNSDNSNKATGNSDSNNQTNDTAASDKFQKYDVEDKIGVQYSISFYKNASVSLKNNRTYLTSGESGSQYSVFLSEASDPQIDCKDTPSTTMQLNGESTTVCYKSDNSYYAGHVKAKNTPLQFNLAGQKPISMEDAKTIMESAAFKQ